MTRIGTLRHRVRIFSVTTEPGVTGAPELTATAVATVWAQVRTMSGSEELTPALDQVYASTLFRVTMRYRSGMAPTMRLEWQGRTLEVLSVEEPDNRQRLLHLVCVEVR